VSVQCTKIELFCDAPLALLLLLWVGAFVRPDGDGVANVTAGASERFAVMLLADVVGPGIGIGGQHRNRRGKIRLTDEQTDRQGMSVSFHCPGRYDAPRSSHAACFPNGIADVVGGSFCPA